MNIHKCDICKKTVDRDHLVVAGVHSWQTKEFCRSCGSPILMFLKKNKFIEKDEKDGKK